MVSPTGRTRSRVRVPYEGATRRATVSETGKDVLPVRFETGEEASVAAKDLQQLKDFETKDPLDGIVGPLSAEEACTVRRRAEELLEVKDAQAAAEWCSAALQRMAFQLEGGAEQHVLALRGREVWEGYAIQADEAGSSQVRFGRLLESPEMRGLLKNSKNGKLQVDPPSEQMLPNERLCSVYAGHLGKEQMELHLSRARCWLALESAQRAVLDCNIALAICRCLAPLPPKRAPGFELTVPLLVLGMAMAFARQYTVGIVLCAGAFLWDYLAQQRAKRQAANADLAKVLALRGRSKLQQGLAGLAQNELRWALEELGPLEEGEEIKKLRRELRQSKTGARKKPLLAPADAAQRTWRTAAADAVQVDGFLSSLNLECHGKALTLADAQAKGDDDRCQLGYMDYCGDGFNAM